ncbi:unnamed protein product [Paramecium sonneborni]|uniref:Uncharacterized protein n=1 Tax=Paramecium sonneborni TaxID=65129 RepID=A0A8S1QYZ9_9CILI|nr:unnamed protein product [Paramecium sonneborni]
MSVLYQINKQSWVLLLKLISEQNKSIRVIQFNYINYIVSIKLILCVNDLYVYRKISTYRKENLNNYAYLIKIHLSWLQGRFIRTICWIFNAMLELK